MKTRSYLLATMVCLGLITLLMPSCGAEIECNDNDGSINPGESEQCDDGVDQGRVGQDLPSADYCVDADADGYYTEDGCGTQLDCNDNDERTYPDAPEIFGDGVDQDCDGRDDNGDWCNLSDGRETDICEDCLDCLCYSFTVPSDWPSGTSGGLQGFIDLNCFIDGELVCDGVAGEGWLCVP